MTPEELEAAKADLHAGALASRESAEAISGRQDVKDAVKSGAADVLSLLAPGLAGLAGGAGGPAAAAAVGVVGAMFTTELHRQLAASAKLALKE